MSAAPVICFGQQPCGFFPRRFLFAKIQTARRLQAEIGGEIVFFYHDSDHDPRETQNDPAPSQDQRAGAAQFRVRQQGPAQVFAALPQSAFPPDWQSKTALPIAQLRRPALSRGLPETLPRRTSRTSAWRCTGGWACSTAFASCVRAIPAFRRAACDVPDFFVDVPLRRRNRPRPLHRRRVETARRRRFLRDAARDCLSPRSRSARRATRGCAGCNRSCTAPITLPGPSEQDYFARKKRRKSLSSTATPSTDPMKPIPNSP